MFFNDETILIRNTNPLIHCITNYVTVNDCANILLSIGASPLMADEISECSEITSKSDCLYVNTGTIIERTFLSMKSSIKEANRMNVPVVLDPVGSGFTAFRTKAVKELLDGCHFSVIRGNLSEIKSLYENYESSKGVDCDKTDEEENILGIIETAKNASIKTSSVIVISGKTDVITDGKKVILVSNGCKMMKSVTGTGCMLSALISAFIAGKGLTKEDIFYRTSKAVILMGIAGEKAFKKLKKKDGNMTYRNYIIDEIFNSDKKTFRMAKYEER